MVRSGSIVLPLFKYKRIAVEDDSEFLNRVTGSATHTSHASCLAPPLGIRGCDGSVLLSYSNGLMTETEPEMSFGVRKLDIINGIKSSLERICPQTASCADIIQLAARDAVYLAGEPYIDVFTGRKDGILASKERADKELPPADISVDKFINIFQQKNITLQERVALLVKSLSKKEFLLLLYIRILRTLEPQTQGEIRRDCRAGSVVAKYGDKSVYFDLEDLDNTTGHGTCMDQMHLHHTTLFRTEEVIILQSKFFETFAAPFTKRGLLLKFLILGGGSTLAYFSSTASGDILPIKKGPQLPPKLGPHGKI
ncbi:hypothetical protein RND71_017144 [Anisodus tanguticus]|uniref:Multifunctional fusion protein n=1 Tax=Anisodus tanguticus TaxID=243964 RepID=A0AAE1S1Q5_9SOLA|nr:hypothetical protein RND71_017144 [Anisodus tanguticus]